MTAINLRDMRIEASAMKLEARMQRKKGNGLVATARKALPAIWNSKPRGWNARCGWIWGLYEHNHHQK